MNKFNIVKKGYDVTEVEAYLSNRERLDGEAMSDKAIRIEELKGDIARLTADIDTYKKREESINLALVTAIEKSNELESQAKIRFALEGERIKLFRGKWISFCDSKKEEYLLTSHEQEFSSKLQDFESELATLMNRKLGLDKGSQSQDSENEAQSQYLSETKRLIDKARAKSKQAVATSGKPCDNAKNKGDNGALCDQFNLDDINNPPELSALCSELI